ncbi:MAG: MBL fold metallo-hydrolase, partial [Byssovorax sp.]
MRRIIAVAAALAALSLSACSAPETAAPTPVVASQAAALGTFTSDAGGFDTHSFYWDTGREVVVFDAQFTEALAEQLIADIKAKTSSPITYVVVTHPNPDKFNGVRPFQALGAKVIASESTAAAIPGVHAYKKYYFVDLTKQLTEETYPAEAKVDITFQGDYTLPLEGGAEVRLHELQSAGVSTTQTVAHIPSQKALIVGDLVHFKAHAWLEGGIEDGKPAPDLASWKQALDELSAYEGATVYGGRGATAEVSVAVKEEKAYLDGMNAIV